VFAKLQERWGGNLGRDHNGRGTCFNWETAARFLREIMPYLVLKREQAELAIMWQWARPEATRNERGNEEEEDPE
jgi:hypothetical protein